MCKAAVGGGVVDRTKATSFTRLGRPLFFPLYYATFVVPSLVVFLVKLSARWNTLLSGMSCGLLKDGTSCSHLACRPDNSCFSVYVINSPLGMYWAEESKCCHLSGLFYETF